VFLAWFFVPRWWENFSKCWRSFYREIWGGAWNRTRAFFWPGTIYLVPYPVFKRKDTPIGFFLKKDTPFGFLTISFFSVFDLFFLNSRSPGTSYPHKSDAQHHTNAHRKSQGRHSSKWPPLSMGFRRRTQLAGCEFNISMRINTSKWRKTS